MSSSKNHMNETREGSVKIALFLLWNVKLYVHTERDWCFFSCNTKRRGGRETFIECGHTRDSEQKKIGKVVANLLHVPSYRGVEYHTH